MSFAINTVYISDHREIVRAVAEHTKDLEQIGAGLYGSVYSNNEVEHVVKVCGGDDGYFSWIKTIQLLGEGNRYLPRIHKVMHYRYPEGHSIYDGYSERKHGHTNNDKLIVYMEKLTTPMKEDHDVPGHYKRHRRFQNFVDWVAKNARAVSAGEYYDCITERVELFDWARFSKDHVELLTLLDIARQQNGNDWYDLHTGNVMMRGNQFVVTDPLCAS